MTMKADPSAAGKESSTGNGREQRPPSHGGGSVRPCSSSEGVWQEALLLAAAGAHVIPLCGPDCPADHPKGKPHPPGDAGKVPLVGGWQKRDAPPERAQVEDWRRRWPAGNVGSGLGCRPALVAVDIDGPEGEELLKRLCGDGLPETCEFTTGRGRRLLFRWPWPDRPARTQHLATGGRPLSFEGDGSQTVMPPSRHLNGKVYAWRPGRSLLDRQPAEAPPGVVEVFSQPPQPKGRTGTNTPSPGQGGAAAGPEYPQRLWRAERYLEKCDRAVQGEGGDAQTYKVACKLVGQFGLSEDDAYGLMKRAYNPRCEPEWSDAALRRKVALAARRHREKPIDLWSEDEFRQQLGRSARRGRAPAPPLPFPARGGEGGLTEGDKAPGGAAPPASPAAGANGEVPPHQPRTRSAEEIRVRPSHHFWHGRMSFGEVNLIDGPKGRGKSTLLAALIADATGGPRLPGPDSDPRKDPLPVLVIPGEESIGRRVVPRLKAAGANLALVHFYNVTEDGHPFDRLCLPDGLGSLEEEVKRLGVRVVTVDPWIKLVPPTLRAKDEQDMRRVLDPLQTLTDQQEFLFVGNRHTRKAQGPAIDAGLGSVAIGNVARGVYMAGIDPEDPSRFMLCPVAVNYGKLPPALYYRTVDRDGIGLVQWEGEADVDADQLVGQPDAADRGALSDGEKFLLRALEKGPRPAKAVKKLAEDGMVTPKQIRTAREKLGVGTAWRQVDGEWRWCWALPSQV